MEHQDKESLPLIDLETALSQPSEAAKASKKKINKLSIGIYATLVAATGSLALFDNPILEKAGGMGGIAGAALLFEIRRRQEKSHENIQQQDLETLVHAISNNTEQYQQKITELELKLEQAINDKEVAESLYQEAEELINKMLGSLEGITATVERDTQGAETLANKAVELEAQTSIVLDLVFEMKGGAQRNREYVEGVTNELEEVMGAIESAEINIENSKKSAEDIRAANENIKDIVSVISGIAGQTNLLSLNATIEAARAGEAGKGFAVVAGEVQSLAKQVESGAEDIEKLVQTANTEAEKGKDITEKTAEAFTQINTLVVNIKESVEDIHQRTGNQLERARKVEEESQQTYETLAQVAALSQVTFVAALNRSKNLSQLQKDMRSVSTQLQEKLNLEVFDNKNSEFALLEWSPDIELGIESIDGQHKVLVGYINNIVNLIADDKLTDKAVIESIQGLAAYTTEHFKFEEEWFRAVDYDDFDAHKAQHDKLLAKVGEYADDIGAGKIHVIPGMLKTLTDWLVGHIKGVDEKYIPLIKENLDKQPEINKEDFPVIYEHGQENN